MKKRKLFSIMIALAVSAAVISCSDSESRMSPLLKKTAVTLNLGLPPENPSADNNSIWNRIRRFFVKDAVAQTAPAAFGSVLVRVAGADFGAMEQTFGGTDAISLSVPSGSLRQFEVIAYTAPGDPSAALSFRGTATADLPAGGTVSIPVVMGLNETKIVAPDGVNQFSPGTAGLVMIDNMDGSNWIHRTAASFAGFSGTLSPYDISFDTRGRIYIANNNTPGVIRMDNINGTDLIQSSASLFETGGALYRTLMRLKPDVLLVNH
jgi:hypothetical protein